MTLCRTKKISLTIGCIILSRQEFMSFLNWLIEFSNTNPKRENAIAKRRKDLSNIYRGAKGYIVPGRIVHIKKYES